MEETIKIYLPFSGFYAAVWVGAIENEIKYLLQQYDREVDHYDDATNYGALKSSLAQEYVSTLMAEAFEETGCRLLLSMAFVGVKSPREYYFETDRLEVEMPKSQVPQLLSMVDWNTLKEMIASDLAPRSGFIPFTSNNIEDWFRISPETWRPSQWELVIKALFKTYGFDWKEVETRAADSDQVRELISEFLEINVAFV